MNLRRLSYRSVRVQGISDEELMASLVLPAAERNRREGITGCLWTGEHSFVQVIEGEDHAVHGLMSRIVSDPRHRAIKMLMNCPARMRLFPTWGLKWVKGGQCVEVDGLSEAIAQRTPKSDPASRALALPPVTVLSPSPADVSCDVQLKPNVSRMAQIVIALVAAESELI